MKRVTGEQFAHEMKRLHTRTVSALRKGMVKSAYLGEALVAKATPVDRGNARNAWSVARTVDGAELFNDAPYAGSLELGSRPHRPPYMPILSWFVRKRTGATISSPEQASAEHRAIAFAIVKKIEKEGTKGNFMVRDNMRKMLDLSVVESDKAMRAVLKEFM